MKDSIICLSGAGVCFVFGVIAFIMGEINVAFTWCVGMDCSSCDCNKRNYRSIVGS